MPENQPTSMDKNLPKINKIINYSRSFRKKVRLEKIQGWKIEIPFLIFFWSCFLHVEFHITEDGLRMQISCFHSYFFSSMLQEFQNAFLLNLSHSTTQVACGVTKRFRWHTHTTTKNFNIWSFTDQKDVRYKRKPIYMLFSS